MVTKEVQRRCSRGATGRTNGSTSLFRTARASCWPSTGSLTAGFPLGTWLADQHGSSTRGSSMRIAFRNLRARQRPDRCRGRAPAGPGVGDRHRHRRLLRRDHSGTVHGRHAAGDVGGRQGRGDKTGGAARGHRESRRQRRQQAGQTAVGRGEERPQADSHPGRRLRRRTRRARRRRHHCRPRPPGRRPRRWRSRAPQGAGGPLQVADRLGQRHRRRSHRRGLRPGPGAGPRTPAHLGGPGRRGQAGQHRRRGRGGNSGGKLHPEPLPIECCYICNARFVLHNWQESRSGHGRRQVVSTNL